jgi:hypothetical protein
VVVAAIVVVVSVALVSVWAVRESPDALAEFGAMWRRPWGKQVFLDFYGLEVVLLLWMIPHASETGSWVAFGLCAATMPFFGAMSAAAYWLLAVG